MPVRAVLFDLDGTLLDTLEDLAASMNAALSRLGGPPHAVDLYRRLVGDGVEMLVRRAFPPARSDEAALREGVRLFREEYARRWGDRTRPYPGVPEMLDGLAARSLPAAILSNKPDDFTRQTTAAFLGRWSFALVWGVGPSVPRKPDPAGALASARTMGVSPADVLFCGDTGTDMRTAGAAGMRPVGALWGFRDAKELSAAGAEVLLARPQDLLDLA